MATKSALDQIAALQEQIETLKQQAVSELAAKIGEKKRELADLEAEYAQLTGKNLKGETSKGVRLRLSKEDKAALPQRLQTYLKQRGESLSFGQIKDVISDAPASAIRAALKDTKLFKMTGQKASARYTAK